MEKEKLRKGPSFRFVYRFILLGTVFLCFILLVVTNTLFTAYEKGLPHDTLLKIQTGLIIGVSVMIIIMGIYTTTMVTVPLNQIIRHIRSQEKLPVKGSAELRVLSTAYNKMYSQNLADKSKLSYEASHDVLTGLYNRKIFEDILADEDIGNYTMILLDIDNFKDINDTYGHDIGDKVLKKLSDALLESFRSDDFPCRIGGDEFAVIMMHVDSRLKELVEHKIKALNELMHDTSDGLPYNSLSIGVAFPDRVDPGESIYADADKALYKAKENGRNTYSFY